MMNSLEIKYKNDILKVFIDPEDYERFSKERWFCTKVAGGHIYFNRKKYIKRENGKDIYKNRSLHREIVGAKKGEYVDHINGDNLDNRKENLRVCTQSENIFNGKKRKNNQSGIMGVYYHPSHKRWDAFINKNRKKTHLGRYKTKEEAVAARQSAELIVYNNFEYANKQ